MLNLLRFLPYNKTRCRRFHEAVKITPTHGHSDCYFNENLQNIFPSFLLNVWNPNFKCVKFNEDVNRCSPNVTGSSVGWTSIDRGPCVTWVHLIIGIERCKLLLRAIEPCPVLSNPLKCGGRLQWWRFLDLLSPSEQWWKWVSVSTAEAIFAGDVPAWKKSRRSMGDRRPRKHDHWRWPPQLSRNVWQTIFRTDHGSIVRNHNLTNTALGEQYYTGKHKLFTVLYNFSFYLLHSPIIVRSAYFQR